jgi:hypothetical protein
MRMLTRKDVVLGAVLLALSLVTLVWLIPVGIDSPGRVPNPALAPAFWPRIIVIAVAGLAVAMIAQGVLRGERAPEPGDPEAGPAFGPEDRWVLAAAGLLALYLWAMHWGGLVVPSMAALAATMALHGERRPVVVLPVSIGVPGILYLFFVELAGMAIPLGVFEGLLG